MFNKEQYAKAIINPSTIWETRDRLVSLKDIVPPKQKLKTLMGICPNDYR